MTRGLVDHVIDCSRAVAVAKHAAAKFLADAPADDQTEIGFRSQLGQELITMSEAMLLNALRAYADEQKLVRP